VKEPLEAFQLLTNKYTAIELDDITKQPITDLLSSQLILNLFLDLIELDRVQNIVNRIMDVHALYAESFTFSSENNYTNEKANKLSREFENMQKENEQSLKDFGFFFQSSMN
jgi:hypothetical protein